MQPARALVTILALSVTTLAAADAFVGTWKLNSTKSQTSSGRAAQASTMTFEATTDGYRVVSTGLKEPLRIRFGKEYRVPNQGIAAQVGAETGSGRRINESAIETTFKRGGDTVATLVREVSADGRVMTTTASGVTTKGEKFKSVLVYEKQ